MKAACWKFQIETLLPAVEREVGRCFTPGLGSTYENKIHESRKYIRVLQCSVVPQHLNNTLCFLICPKILSFVY